MNSHYFKEHIEEELDGARDYAKKAIEIKPMNPEWSENYKEMGTQELKHAHYLHDMYSQYITKLKETYNPLPSYIAEDWEEVSSCYERKKACATQLLGI